jgi:tetratricopeptide (TPR) repeat protein
MSLFGKLFSRDAGGRIDYYEEGVSLLRSGQHHEALTSLRLALRENPDDAATLQQIAVAYSHIGMTDEAIRTYRTVLRKDPSAAAARYGLAFLLLRAGREDEAAELLEVFLQTPPDGPDAARHVQHARSTLASIRGEPQPAEGAVADADGAGRDDSGPAARASGHDRTASQQEPPRSDRAEAWPSP